MHCILGHVALVAVQVAISLDVCVQQITTYFDQLTQDISEFRLSSGFFAVEGLVKISCI